MQLFLFVLRNQGNLFFLMNNNSKKNKNLRNERAVVFPKNIFVKDAMQEITTLGDDVY